MQANKQHSGCIVVNKPEGVTSHDVVAAMRRVLHMKKVGHAGTLDPMATGVLVVGFGSATRLLGYLGDSKSYDATIRLGQVSDTDDRYGTVITSDEHQRALISWLHSIVMGIGLPCDHDNGDQVLESHATSEQHEVHDVYKICEQHESNAACEQRNPFQFHEFREVSKSRQTCQPCNDKQLTAAIQQLLDEYFTGTIKQQPSSVSAIKINGQRAYDLVRQGQQVQLASRTIHIASCTAHRCAVQTLPNGQVVLDLALSVSCSSGTYIRAIARDLGQVLGVGGHLTKLCRTRVGGFTLDQAVQAQSSDRAFVDKLGNEVHVKRCVLSLADDEVEQYVISPAQTARRSLPVVQVNREDAGKLRHGIALPWNHNALEVMQGHTGNTVDGQLPHATTIAVHTTVTTVETDVVDSDGRTDAASMNTHALLAATDLGDQADDHQPHSVAVAAICDDELIAIVQLCGTTLQPTVVFAQ